TWSYPLTTLDSTTYTVIAWSWDGANNISSLAQSSFSVGTADTTPPTVTITDPADGSNQSGPDVTISGTAADTQSGVSRVKVMIQRQSDSTYWDGTTWSGNWSWVDATGTETWSYPMTLETDTYVAIAWSWDGANNISNLHQSTFGVTS
ncbi:MAG: hypothetical protein HKO03_08515, partial [Acidimicrobiia bacterium]|nr:hypothetical protein [Acidimicrobiia bacterium]